jgi:hypothetical protein
LLWLFWRWGSQTICRGWLCMEILQILAFQISRTIGAHHPPSHILKNKKTRLIFSRKLILQPCPASHSSANLSCTFVLPGLFMPVLMTLSSFTKYC